MKKLLSLLLAMVVLSVASYADPLVAGTSSREDVISVQKQIVDQVGKPADEEKTLNFKFNKTTVEAINKALKETTVEYALGVKAIDLTKTWEGMFTKDKTEIEVKLKESEANALFAGIDNSNASHNLCKTLLQIMVNQAQPQLTPPKKE